MPGVRGKGKCTLYSQVDDDIIVFDIFLETPRVLFIHTRVMKRKKRDDNESSNEEYRRRESLKDFVTLDSRKSKAGALCRVS